MSEEIEIEMDGDKKPAKAAKAKIEAKKPTAKAAAKPVKKEAKAAKPAKKDGAKAAKPAKKPAAKKESSRPRYTVAFTGETISIKVDKVFEKMIAAFIKHYQFEDPVDAHNDILKSAFGRFAALQKWKDKQGK